MKKNIGKADRFNRALMIPLLITAAIFISGWLRYVFVGIAVYEIYTVFFNHCFVYQMLKFSSRKNDEY